MNCNSETVQVMTIDGHHYIKSAILSDNPYELTILCDTLWEGEVFEVPATVDYQGREYTVTGIYQGDSSKLENLRELRIPPTVQQIFPEACVGITSLRKVNIPDHCRVYSGAFAHCGIEELKLGEYVILEADCFEGIRAKQVNIPDTTKLVPYPEDDEPGSRGEAIPVSVSADKMYNFIETVFRNSIWHYLELLKFIIKGEEWAVQEFAGSDIIDLKESQPWRPFSLNEILSLMDENGRQLINQLINQFEDNRSRIINASVSDGDDLPF